MARDKGAFRLYNPWPRFAWLTWAAISGIAFVSVFYCWIVINKMPRAGPVQRDLPGSRHYRRHWPGE
jgi:hypothetical protein